MTDREARIKKLAARLEDGYQRIEEAIAQRNYRNVEDWTRFWESLLHEYESLVDEVEDNADAVEQAVLL